MFTASFKIKSVTPLSYSKYLTAKKESNQTHDEFEEVIWREKAHVNDDGQVYLPGIMLKKALASTAQFLSEKVPGKGKSTYTKHFRAGVLPPTDSLLINGKTGNPITKDDLRPETVPCQSQGGKGGSGGSTVLRTFPMIDNWECDVEMLVADDEITKDVFTKYVRQAGIINGLGRFRPQNGGTLGRFEVVGDVDWVQYKT